MAGEVFLPHWAAGTTAPEHTAQATLSPPTWALGDMQELRDWGSLPHGSDERLPWDHVLPALGPRPGQRPGVLPTHKGDKEKQFTKEKLRGANKAQALLGPADPAPGRRGRLAHSQQIGRNKAGVTAVYNIQS